MEERMKKDVTKKRRWMLAGLGVFLTTATLAVVVNSFVFGYGFDPARSISQYVGLESWSVIVFALGNIFATWATERYMWMLGRQWQMPRWYYYFAFLTGLGLVMLSVLPFGYFDTPDKKSIVTYGHEFASRMMFLMMLLVALMIVIKTWQRWRTTTGSERSKTWPLVVVIVYILYGILCVVGRQMKTGWVVSYFLFYEGMYISGFVGMLACQKMEPRKTGANSTSLKK